MDPALTWCHYVFSLRQNTERISPVQQFNNQHRLGAVFTFECQRIFMQLSVMFSAKWDRKNIVSLCTDAALTPANQMVCIIGGLPAAHAGLGLHPGKKIRDTQRMRLGRAKNVLELQSLR
jgi:hypothetical protein